AAMSEWKCCPTANCSRSFESDHASEWKSQTARRYADRRAGLASRRWRGRGYPGPRTLLGSLGNDAGQLILDCPDCSATFAFVARHWFTRPALSCSISLPMLAKERPMRGASRESNLIR